MISLVALGVFFLGALFGVFDRLERRLARSGPVAGNVFAVLLILAAVFAVFAVRRMQQAEREAELREDAERRFRTIVERVPAVAYTWDAADTPGSAPVSYISPQIETLLVYTAEEWIADPELWSCCAHPDDQAPMLASWAEAVSRGSTFTGDYRMRTKDGRLIWVREEAVPVGTGTRGPIYQGVLFDITQQKLAEERYRQLVEQLPVITYLAEPAEHGGIHVLPYMAPGIRALTGRPASAFEADPELWASILHPDDRDRVLEEDRRTERSGDRFEIEYRLVPVDGSVVWVRDTAVLVERDGRDRPLWQGFIEDVTARHEAEEQLRLAQDRYRQLVERLPATVYVDAVDDVSTATYVSPQYETLTGYTPEERLSQPDLWVRMLHPADREWVLAENTRTNVTGDPFDAEYRIVAKDGRTVWVHDLAYLVDEEGGPVWQGVVSDITERKLAEEGLARRDRILEAVGRAAGRFLGVSSWMDAMTDVLAHLGEAGAASRAAVYRNELDPEGRLCLTMVHEWTAPGVPPLAEIVQDRLIAFDEVGLSRWPALLEAGEPIHGLAAEFPPEERAALERGGVRALVVMPIVVAGRWWGHLAYDQAEEDRVWQQAELDALHVIANTLGAAIGREEAARKLSETEARYQSLIEAIPAGTYIDTVDAVSTPIYMSPQVKDIFGYSPEQWVADPKLWERGVHPDDLPELLEKIEQLNTEGVPYEAEYRFRRPDGRTVWVHDQAVVIRDEQGAPQICQGVMFDITERREAEEQLREAEERFRAIVEHVPAAIYLDKPDASMETLYISPQVEEMTGITADEWLADPDAWKNALAPEDRDRVLRAYLAAVEEGAPWSGEYRIRTRDGRTIWVRDETVYLHDEEGNRSMMQGVIFDITEMKLAEQALRESEQREREAAERLRALDEMKNTFLAAVSHELRSPLTSILGLALTLERSEMADDDRNDLLERLATNARKLDRLLKDLLDIDRLNRGIVEPQCRVTDVGALARRTIESLDPLADRSIMVFADPVVLSVDPAKVERIVENLLMNAARHTTPDRTIWLRVQPEGDGVLLCVEDDGPGVPRELREAIFEPFRQGPTTSPHAPGTGIGLSLVARFAELHGGRAWVQEREGGGASFRVFLPAGPVAEIAPSANGNGAPAHHNAPAVGSAEAG